MDHNYDTAQGSKQWLERPGKWRTADRCPKDLHALIGDNIIWEGTRKRCRECKSEQAAKRRLKQRNWDGRNRSSDKVTRQMKRREKNMLTAETTQVKMTLLPARRSGDPALILKGKEFAIDIDGLYAIREFRETLNELLTALDKKTETV